MQIKYIFFDFFGTLVKRNKEVVKNNFFKALITTAGVEYKVDSPEKLKEISRIFSEELAKREVPPKYKELSFETLTLRINSELGSGLDPDKVRQEFSKASQNNTFVYEDTVPTLKRLFNQYKLGIVSNALTTKQVALVAERLGFSQYLQIIITSAEEGIKKPNPIIYERACKKMSEVIGELVFPQECLFVGNKFSDDVFAPREVGMKSLQINRRQRNDIKVYGRESIQVYSVKDLQFIETVLERLR